uniref:Uncharacterized protein n=1 Tax=Spongospora subterranea TaxID=70186 RepID=A0A0H5RP41_9EUKA|eukprot:CRZ10494.1 hypothetical protein [Spongospora subterranea]
MGNDPISSDIDTTNHGCVYTVAEHTVCDPDENGRIHCRKVVKSYRKCPGRPLEEIPTNGPLLSPYSEQSGNPINDMDIFNSMRNFADMFDEAESFFRRPRRSHGRRFGSPSDDHEDQHFGSVFDDLQERRQNHCQSNRPKPAPFNLFGRSWNPHSDSPPIQEPDRKPSAWRTYREYRSKTHEI